MQRIEQNQNKKKKVMFLEGDVTASYLGVLTRFLHRMKLQVLHCKKKACNAHQIWCATFVPSGTPYMA